ncbi:fibronectin type III domain-containing protein [Cohnella caldifontis]|uniref:fibronectin type III domain-containing protein n=1 Tax=Cohnella caldifontis TaxID=3027471 RepID=UPI0023ED15F0|nr:fibronectin type III domain-containing protein [Cohnella sp. YIM B05605]
MLAFNWKRVVSAALAALVIWQTLGLTWDIGVGKAAAAAGARSWQLLGSGAVDDSVSANSVTIATYGNTPYIAFNDNDSSQIRIKEWASGSWQMAGNNGNDFGPGSNLKLAISPSGRAYLSFLNSIGQHPAVLWMNEQQDWGFLGEAELSANTAIASDIAVSADDQVYVAYEDSGGSSYTYKAMLRVFENGVWSDPEAVTDSRGMAPSVTLDAGGKPTVAYTDYALGELPRIKSRISAGNWTAVPSGSLMERGNYAVIRAAGDGSLFLAYLNADTVNTGVTGVKRYDGTNWWSYDFNSDGGEGPAMAIDPLDQKPVLAYVGRPDEGNKIHVLKWDGFIWNELGQASELPANASSLSLAIGADGTPYVAYLDKDNHYAPKVIGYLPDLTPPSVTAQYPAPNETEVPVNAKLTATFSKTVQGIAEHFIEICKTDSTECQRVDASSEKLKVSGNVATVEVPLRGGTSYRAVAEAGTFVDLNGTPTPAIEWTFTTAVTVPDAPVITDVSPGDGKVEVSFNSPENNGGSLITGYTVTIHPSTGEDIVEHTTETPYMRMGLTNGQTYSLTITATNSVGTSLPTAAKTFVPSTVPGAPTIKEVVVGSRQATVSFEPPASDGFSRITNYTVLATSQDNVPTRSMTGTESPITVVGLMNGHVYSFTVVAVNARGDSAPSEALLGTPATVPGAPTNVTAVGGDEEATVSFTPPASDGGSSITGYRVTTIPGNSSEAPISVTVGPGATSAVITGLRNGGDYQFKVVAMNAQGPSAEAQTYEWTHVGRVPAKPYNLSAIAGDGKATVSFDEPANGGLAITNYRVTAWAGSTAVKQVEGASSPIEVTGLRNGTAYTFTVEAYNEKGWSPASDSSLSVTPEPAPVTPSTVPGAPTNVRATAGNGQASVSFNAPASDGGSPITGYRVTAWQDGRNVKEATGSSSPITVTGLTNGTAYTFTVAAINANGPSPESDASASVTPSAPTAPSASGGGGTSSNTYGVSVTVGGVQLGTLNVRRETLADGTVKDTLELTGSYAEEAASKLKAAGESRLSIVLPSVSGESAELVLRMSKEAAGALAGAGISLGLRTADAEIAIPAGSLQNAADPIQLSVTPLTSTDRKSELQKRAEKSTVLRSAAGQGTVTLIGNPVDIATDWQNRKMTLTLPADTGVSDIGVYVEHSDGTVELVRGKYLQDGPGGKPRISFEANKFSTFAVVRVAGWDEFSKEGQPPQTQKPQPYISGYAGGLFKPNASMTRAEMAAILVQAFADDATGETKETGTFYDVPAGHWAADAIRVAAARGLMSGYPDGTFRPDKPITRAEMAALLSLLIRSAGDAAGQGGGFADTDGHWAQAAIRKAQTAGLISGYGDGTFRPDRTLTRAEAVVIVNKLLQINPNDGATPYYSDVPRTHWAYGAVQAASKR